MQYKVEQRTIVFGGHDTWLKAIKPMLIGNIRFIGREQSVFDKAMFRNTDVIWIQHNSLAHKQFYRAINNARAHNIPVFYFSNASARKCAMQVEEKDKSGR